MNEISRPPIGGMIRRTGVNTGSTSIATYSVQRPRRLGTQETSAYTSMISP
jgi:hypothetical protein